MIAVLTAAGVALFLTLFGTPLLIRFFRKHKVGEVIREDGPSHHLKKSGTPTMGGVAILLAATLGYVAGHRGDGLSFESFSSTGLLTLGCAWALGILGAVDDIAKIRAKSLGLNKRTKFACQLLVGGALAWGAVHLARVPSEITWTGVDAGLFPVGLPLGLFAVWVVVMVASTSNAVNLADGLDGLASGVAAAGLFVYTIISFWQWRNRNIYFLGLSIEELQSLEIQNLLNSDQLGLAIVAAAFLGACIGFMWWNAWPAKIFMGDTGSLALGGVLASLALLTRTQLLLLVVGGVFVIETVSVIAQVAVFRTFRGRRIFRMAPIHHHFEMLGWAEATVIIRFWLVGASLSGLGLALFYKAFLEASGTG